jgi:hypothetical protein
MSRTVTLHGGPYDQHTLTVPDAWTTEPGCIRLPRTCIDDGTTVTLTYKPDTNGVWRLFDVEDT